MSKLVQNLVDTARLFRGQPFTAKFETNHTSVCLISNWLGFEISKHDPRGRFFADKQMIAYAGGPWFIQQYKERFKAQIHKLSAFHLLLRINDIQAKDLFSYRTCSFELETNHPTRSAPVALQIVQKAMIFSIADEVLSGLIQNVE